MSDYAVYSIKKSTRYYDKLRGEKMPTLVLAKGKWIYAYKFYESDPWRSSSQSAYFTEKWELVRWLSVEEAVALRLQGIL